MSRTPWGDAAELRERQLAPGRGTPREEVERNQRERLFAAMVASVDSRGYEATRVADVLELAGVSRKAFYRHFADKEECFAEAITAIVDRTVEVLREQVEDGGAPIQGEKGLEVLLWGAATQPAAARACVIEAFAAGPATRAKLEQTVLDVEWAAADLIGEGHGGRMDRALVRAALGGISVTVYRMLSEEREEELPGLAQPLWRWASSLQPLPRPLPAEKPNRTRKPAGVPFEARVPTERILYGFAAAVAEHGYVEVPIAAIASHGRVSLSTFYEHFDGKKEALAAALKAIETQLLTATLSAARTAGHWGAALRAGCAAAMEFFAAEPDLAQLWIVEVLAAGPEAVARRDRLNRELLATVATLGGTELEQLDEVAVEATLGALQGLMYERVRSQGAAGLPSLVPMLTYVAAVPFVGAEAAWRAARGEE